MMSSAASLYLDDSAQSFAPAAISAAVLSGPTEVELTHTSGLVAARLPFTFVIGDLGVICAANQKRKASDC